MREDESSERTENREAVREKTYRELLLAAQREPFSEEAWSRTVALARSEEASGGGAESFYSHIPLEELITFGEHLRSVRSHTEHYGLLTERASTGERWYDLVLGHVNDKAFAPIAQHLDFLSKTRGRKWECGLDVGSGTGNTLRAIAPNFQKVIGVDRLAFLLQQEQNEGTLPENVEVIAAGATRLPLAPDTIDIAVSNGLTRYLSKGEMQRYVEELARVLKRDGSYFESWVTKEKKDDPLSRVEQEYLTDAKALLVYLIDSPVSRPDEALQWSARDMIDAFHSHGFAWSKSEPNDDGVLLAKFYRATD